MIENVAIVLAGGRGERFGTYKQYVQVCGKPIYVHTLLKFQGIPTILVVPEEHREKVGDTVESVYGLSNVNVVGGGADRQESVWKALQYIKRHMLCNKILICDANRPLLSQKTIDTCIELLSEYVAVVAVSKSVDTACRGANGYLRGVLPRNDMYNLLMPQCFPFNSLYAAHSTTELRNATDDTQIAHWLQPLIHLMEIPKWEGIKLTTPDDLYVIEALMRKTSC